MDAAEAQAKTPGLPSTACASVLGMGPSSQPAWLTAEFYTQKIQPRVAELSVSAIASRIGVSRWYAGRIRKGYVPHPRHWGVLAELTGRSKLR